VELVKPFRDEGEILNPNGDGATFKKQIVLLLVGIAAGFGHGKKFRGGSGGAIGRRAGIKWRQHKSLFASNKNSML
jgi:hypothetical protein